MLLISFHVAAYYFSFSFEIYIRCALSFFWFKFQVKLPKGVIPYCEIPQIDFRAGLVFIRNKTDAINFAIKELQCQGFMSTPVITAKPYCKAFFLFKTRAQGMIPALTRTKTGANVVGRRKKFVELMGMDVGLCNIVTKWKFLHKFNIPQRNFLFNALRD